ncbi:Serine/arginine repetitive matrix protein 1 [Penicillium rolfsii]|nr:Serine/arginine repetitive matrix protein 1 [Penicillium rolfsii]
MATLVDAKLLKKTKFPPEFNQKVDMTKLNIEVMKKWINKRISEILGNEDDVVIELCSNLLEGSRYPDIKALQIQLTGFLDKDTPKFCKELWTLCLSGQENPQGIPKEILEAKKLELMQEKIAAEKAAEAARREREEERLRERELNDMRRRERSERGDRNYGNFGGRGRYDRRRSRSPPPSYGRSRYRDRGSPRHRDSPPRRRDSPPRRGSFQFPLDRPDRTPPHRKPYSFPLDRPDRTPPRARSSSRSPSRFTRPDRTPSRSPVRFRRNSRSPSNARLSSRSPRSRRLSRSSPPPFRSTSRSPSRRSPSQSPERNEKRPCTDPSDRERSNPSSPYLCTSLTSMQKPPQRIAREPRLPRERRPRERSLERYVPPALRKNC